MKKELVAVDLFCGIGGLSYGLKQAGINVVAGIDSDTSCEYAYEANIKGEFIGTNVQEVKGDQLVKKYWGNDDKLKVLVGCAPCQPFSTHSNKNKEKEKSEKWGLLGEFLRIIEESNPEVISMENVPNLSNQKIFNQFVKRLHELGYFISYKNVYCPDYGIPQKRRRLVLLGSKFGEISLTPPTHTPSNYVSTKQAIGHLPSVEAGEKIDGDALHWTTRLTDTNLQRIKASNPNGTWLDWDESLRLNCHKKNSGSSYKSVYGRMSWDEPSPTITTQFYNYGTGRFGHPEQHRALTIREAAILQTFPEDFIFSKKDEDVYLTKVGTHIGNAVPVKLGYVVGVSIKQHLRSIEHE